MGNGEEGKRGKGGKKISVVMKKGGGKERIFGCRMIDSNRLQEGHMKYFFLGQIF
jgi:hypothetical protein